MGVAGLWAFLRRKGYDPVLRHRAAQLPQSSHHKIRVDVLGSLYTTIRYAYSSHSLEEAHRILEREIIKFGTKDQLVLYLDGHSSKEKEATRAKREERRNKALNLADKYLDELADRMERGARVRKHHFVNIKKNLAIGFHWPLETRRSFVEYMSDQQWTINLCPTEADLAIAIESQPGDIAISKDSDLLVYKNIETIWRPITKDRLLVYHVADVLDTLGLSKSQITALGVVSRNDYDSNIAFLGPETNYDIIKSLDGRVDAAAIVEEYKACPQVILKNPGQDLFSASRSVFIDHRQTPVQTGSSPPGIQQADVSYDDLHKAFDVLCVLYRRIKEEQKQTVLTKESESTDARAQRHKAGQNFNRYRTIDQPAQEDTNESLPATSRLKTPRQRPRYSFKTRRRLKEHDPPATMKQYRWKPWTKVPDNPLGIKSSTPTTTDTTGTTNTNTTTTRPTPIDINTNKATLVRTMAKEHPTVVIQVGTLSANVRRAIGESHLALEVQRCLREIVRLAADTKRQGQRLIGRYLEVIFASGELSETDRSILNYMCPSVSSRVKKETTIDNHDQQEEEKDNEDEEQELRFDDPSYKESDEQRFYTMLLQYLYSGNPVDIKSVVGKRVQQFVDRAVNLGLWEKGRSRGAILVRMLYPASSLLRSVSQELYREVKKKYRNGSVELEKKVQGLIAKGLVAVPSEINNNLPSIENFILLNRSSRSFRRIVPLTGVEQPFVSFSERELGILLWKNEIIKQKLQELALEDYTDKTIETIQSDLDRWLRKRSPGSLITTILSNIGRKVPRKGRRGLKDSTSMMDMTAMRDHLQLIQNTNFDPKTYEKRGYVHRGSIRTDGFRLQFLVFKLKELQSVRYRRFPAEYLPNRITNTVGGCDYYLTEVRNIVKTPQDVIDLWECSPDEIKILGLDLGQACVVGASAIVPRKILPKNDVVLPKERAWDTSTDIEMEEPSGSGEDVEKKESFEDKASAPVHHVFRNLAVKQKAVYQPTFKHRKWMEWEKNKDLGQGLSSISAIETRLPPQSGAEASLTSYLAGLGAVKNQLDEFYNGKKRFKRHKWDEKRAREEEYRTITDRLLKMVGGSIGAKRQQDNKVVIGVGLGKFSAKTKLTSLHESFQSYFVQKARALGYIVVGVNEYYTSKKCPVCQNFVGQVEIRRLYCTNCKTYMHRDIMAGHNICNVIRGHLINQTRPLYLQPIDKDGHYPWMEASSSSDSSIHNISSDSSNDTSSSSIINSITGNVTSNSVVPQGRGKGQGNSRKRAAPMDENPTHSKKRATSMDKNHPFGRKRGAPMDKDGDIKSRL